MMTMTAYPGVALVVSGNFYPQVNDTVLKVFEIPEESFLDARVAVPALILTTRARV